MPFRAQPDRFTRISAAALITVFIAAVPWAAPSIAAQVTSQGPTAEDQFYEFKIVAASDEGDQLTLGLQDDGSWQASLENGDARWSTNDRACPSLKAALDKMKDLPPLSIGPFPLREGAGTHDLAPYTPHAAWWVIQLAGYAPNRTATRLVMHGAQGPYAAWASRVVQGIKGCPEAEISGERG